MSNDPQQRKIRSHSSCEPHRLVLAAANQEDSAGILVGSKFGQPCGVSSLRARKGAAPVASAFAVLYDTGHSGTVLARSSWFLPVGTFGFSHGKALKSPITKGTSEEVAQAGNRRRQSGITGNWPQDHNEGWPLHSSASLPSAVMYCRALFPSPTLPIQRFSHTQLEHFGLGGLCSSQV